MEKRRIFGLILLAVGVFFIANSRANITGAVISTSIMPSISLIFGAIFIVASFLLFLAGGLEKRIRGEEEEEPEYEVQPPNKIILSPNDFVIIDTCGADDYERAEKLDEMLKMHPTENFLITKEVFDELPKRLKEKLAGIEEESKKYGGYEIYAKRAKNILKKSSPKRKYVTMLYKGFKGVENYKQFKNLRNLLKGSEEAESKQLYKVTSRVIKNMKEETKQNGKYFYFKGGDKEFESFAYSPPGGKKFIKDFLKELVQYGRITKADVSVVAGEMYGARLKKRAIAISADTDVREAIKFIKSTEPRLGKNMQYADYRIYAH